MKISFPSFFPSLIVIVVTFSSGNLFFKFLAKLSDGSKFSWEIIGILIIVLVFPISLFFIILKWKIILINRHNIKTIYPLRLKILNINIKDIKEIDWWILSNHRFGDYLILDLVDSSGRKILISDLEFQNYKALEKIVIENIKIKPNLNKRKRLLLEQAKSNSIFNLIFLLASFYLIYIELSKVSKGENLKNIDYLIIILSILSIIILTLQVIEYIKTIKNYEQHRL